MNSQGTRGSMMLELTSKLWRVPGYRIDYIGSFIIVLEVMRHAYDRKYMECQPEIKLLYLEDLARRMKETSRINDATRKCLCCCHYDWEKLKFTKRPTV
jgi:hypothetical protein